MILILWFIPSLWANFDSSELVVSARALGMGEAFIAKADDSSGVFYNPAGLGTVRYPQFHFGNIQLMINEGWYQTTIGGHSRESLNNTLKSWSSKGKKEIALDYPNEILASRIQFMPHWTFRYFSLGGFYVSKSKFINKEHALRNDHGLYGGLNMSLWGGILKLGVMGIYLKRRERAWEFKNQ